MTPGAQLPTGLAPPPRTDGWDWALLAIGAAFVLGGAILVTGCITFNVPSSDPSKAFLDLLPRIPTSLGLAGVIIGIAFAVWGLKLLQSPSGHPDEVSRTNYQRSLVGLGYFLLLDAIVTLTAMAGFAHTGLLDKVLKTSTLTGGRLPPIQQETIETVALLVGSLAMGILGALFYVTNSLRLKREKDEEFDWTIFWSGLWYRLGEAILFVIVFFVALRRFGGPDGDDWMPIVSLFLGMFVTSGERLVFGLARRVFAAVGALLPIEPADVDAAFETRVPQAPAAPKASVEDDTVVLTWNRPEGQPVRKYRVESRTPKATSWNVLATPDKEGVQIPLPKDWTELQFRVIALNDAGESSPSPTCTISKRS